MSDTNGRKPSRIIPLRDHRDPSGKSMTAQQIKEEIIAGVAAGSLAMGQKVYEQVMENVTRLLGEMEERLRQDFAPSPVKADGIFIAAPLSANEIEGNVFLPSEGPE